MELARGGRAGEIRSRGRQAGQGFDPDEPAFPPEEFALNRKGL